MCNHIALSLQPQYIGDTILKSQRLNNRLYLSLSFVQQWTVRSRVANVRVYIVDERKNHLVTKTIYNNNNNNNKKSLFKETSARKTAVLMRVK